MEFVVNGIAPGLFDTPLTREPLRDPSIRRWMERHTPEPDRAGPRGRGGGRPLSPKRRGRTHSWSDAFH